MEELLFQLVPETTTEIGIHSDRITCMVAEIYQQYTEIVDRLITVYRLTFESPVKQRDAETLSHIANGYATTLDVIESRLEELMTSDDQQYRKVFYGIIQHDLDARLALVNSCLSDIREIHRSLITRAPLVQPPPEYADDLPDLMYFFTYETFNNDYLYNVTTASLVELQYQITNISGMTEQAFVSQDLNITEFTVLKQRSIANARGISLHWAELKTYILKQPLERFQVLNGTMQQVNADVHGPLDLMPTAVTGE